MARRNLSAALVLILSFAVPARLAFAADVEPERPWAHGVSEQNQKAALELFRDGNASLKESLFVDAVNKYREALKLWDHPAIHYNLALALLNLDKPVELHEHLVEALKYGAAPLDSDKFDQANRYKALVERQLAKVDIRCDEPGAQVRMDGKELFTAPGQYQGLVRAGPHTVIATKEGFLTRDESKTLPPGELSSFNLKLFNADDMTQYRRKWDAWVPWAVVAGGATVLGTGVAMHMSAKDAFTAYDKEISDCSRGSTSGGCIASPTVAGEKQRGQTLQTVAMGAYGVGAAALVTGGVLVWVNRLQPYKVNPDEKSVDVAVAPFFAPGAGGAQALVRF